MQLITLAVIGFLINMKVKATTKNDILSSSTFENEVFDMIRSVQIDSAGVLHLDDDGVLRSYDRAGNVLDYRRFNSSHLMTVANQYSGDLQSHLFEVWDGVDSFEVEEQQIWNPVNNPYQSLFPRQGMSDRRTYSPLTRRVECDTVWCDSHETCHHHRCFYCFFIDRVADGHCRGYGAREDGG
ncbi:hypothetical protein I7I48_10771 [Histoplasma ohiense]|nr:hypothetical protein I7I48_10771 [Histoplasma ohiense (nom. inval.)]